MNENELIQLWKSTNERLENNLSVTQKNTKEITGLKVKDFLSSMKPIKIFTVLIGIIWVIIVDSLIIDYWNKTSYFFLSSAIIQVLITKIAIGIYFYQLMLIQQVDVSEPVVVAQKRLLNIRVSTLWVYRILFLQLPVWTTFYLNEFMLANGNLLLWILQGIITLSFTFLAFWLFININIKNKDKRWFRVLLNLKEWSPIVKSIALLEQVEDYNLENE